MWRECGEDKEGNKLPECEEPTSGLEGTERAPNTPTKQSGGTRSSLGVGQMAQDGCDSVAGDS